jgi:UDP-N-acetylenolpyruvoylglucosamine reductase
MMAYSRLNVKNAVFEDPWGGRAQRREEREDTRRRMEEHARRKAREQPAFWISAGCWYPNPPTGKAAFRVSGKLVCEEGASDTPRYYLG